jgi:hypothetical protein
MEDILKRISEFILSATEEEKDVFWDGLHQIHVMSLLKKEMNK